jgi:hypothetical protein
MDLGNGSRNADSSHRLLAAGKQRRPNSAESDGLFLVVVRVAAGSILISSALIFVGEPIVLSLCE